MMQKFAIKKEKVKSTDKMDRMEERESQVMKNPQD